MLCIYGAILDILDSPGVVTTTCAEAKECWCVTCHQCLFLAQLPVIVKHNNLYKCYSYTDGKDISFWCLWREIGSRVC